MKFPLIFITTCYPIKLDNTISLCYDTRAIFERLHSFGLQKYPRGRRGSPAKGVDVSKACEGSNPSFCATKEHAIACSFIKKRKRRVTEAVITGRS